MSNTNRIIDDHNPSKRSKKLEKNTGLCHYFLLMELPTDLFPRRNLKIWKKKIQDSTIVFFIDGITNRLNPSESSKETGKKLQDLASALY